LDGVRQYPGTSYTETDNNTITFSAGLHVGALVMVISNQSVDTANLQASAVHYTPTGTGAITTNVQTKLRENVSVKDFGAVGDYNTGTSTGTNNPTYTLNYDNNLQLLDYSRTFVNNNSVFSTWFMQVGARYTF
jgi:hypothetical protein